MEKKMKSWTKSDIGKILVYRKEMGFEQDEAVAIYGINSDVPNTVRIVEYPISLNSKIGLLGLVKSQEKGGRKYLEKPGDWFYVDEATKEEREVLDKIARTPKTLSNIC
jgi:hypothetical protein